MKRALSAGVSETRLERRRQAAKERKEDQERKTDEHKTEVDKLKREKRDMAAAADVAREKLAQVESKVETLSQEKVLSSFVSVRYSITPALVHPPPQDPAQLGRDPGHTGHIVLAILFAPPLSTPNPGIYRVGGTDEWGEPPSLYPS